MKKLEQHATNMDIYISENVDYIINNSSANGTAPIDICLSVNLIPEFEGTPAFYYVEIFDEFTDDKNSELIVPAGRDIESAIASIIERHDATQSEDNTPQETTENETTARSLGAELIERYVNRSEKNRQLFKSWFEVNARQLDDIIAGRAKVEDFISYADLDALAELIEYAGDAWSLLNSRRKRKTRRTKLSREAYAEQQRQRKAKLGGRVELTPREKQEYAELNAAGKLHKTTRDTLTIYAEPGYEIRHAVMDRNEYFVFWERETTTERSYLGYFSNDEQAITALEDFKRTHRAYGRDADEISEEEIEEQTEDEEETHHVEERERLYEDERSENPDRPAATGQVLQDVRQPHPRPDTPRLC